MSNLQYTYFLMQYISCLIKEGFYMKQGPLNSAQLYYGRFFPEILNIPPNPETNEYLVGNPLNAYKNKMTIDAYGLFSAANPPYRGFITDFLMIAEGLPEEIIYEDLDKIKDGISIPTVAQINEWHNALLAPKGKELLDYLMNERGLTIETIKKYSLGFNEPENELVFPAFNITRTTLNTVKFTKFPFNSTASKNKSRIAGYPYLLGYHRLKFQRDHRPKKYITINEIDALYLRQLGLETYCSLTENCELLSDWYPIFKNLDVIIFSSFEEESIINTKEFAIDNLRSLKRTTLGHCYLSDYFVKAGNTLSDLDSLVEATPQMRSEYFESSETLKIIDASLVDMEYIYGVQDISKIGFIYGAKFQNDFYFITSGRKIITEKRMIMYRVAKKGAFDRSRFTYKLAEDYTQRNLTVKAIDVFNSIRSYIRKYIHFTDESLFDLLSLWCMGTYVFSIFRHFPYIHIQAEKNSGKSQLMEVLAAICFNGKYYINPTGPTLFREANRDRPTMFIDESENLANRTSQPGYMELLNSGFQKGALVTREKGGQSIDFSVYCPKMFAGIKSMNDVLRSRSIHIKMIRKLAEERVVRYTDDEQTSKSQRDIMDGLYIFGLQYAVIIQDIYHHKIKIITALNDLENRQYDIWTPLFIIAHILDNENKNSVLSDSLSSYLIKQRAIQQNLEQIDNPIIRLLSKLNEVLNKITPVKEEATQDDRILTFTTASVFEEFKSDPEWKKETPTVNKLTLHLLKIEINVKPVNVGGKTERCYVVDMVNLIKFGTRYGYEFRLNK